MGIFGVRGEVRVHGFTTDPRSILDHAVWHLGRERPERRILLEEGRIHGKGLVVRLEGVADPETAKGLFGWRIWIPRAAFPDPTAEEYYWGDLIGCQVETEEGVPLGTVRRMMETGANDVLVVGGVGEERLLPFIQDVVLHVDFDANRIIVRLMSFFNIVPASLRQDKKIILP